MKAILPVAGFGSRLRPHTHTVPKALVHVAGKPVLGHILDALLPAGVDEVVLIIGHLGEKVVEYVRHHYDVRVHFAYQKELKGLGHAIHMARELVNPLDPVLIVLGDTIFSADLSPVVGAGQSAIGVMPVPNPSSFGVVELDGDRIRRLVEKPTNPPTNLAVVGVYYLRQAGPLFGCLDELIEKDIKTRGEYQLTDALQMLIERGTTIHTFPIDEWLDCGSPEALLQTNRRLLETNGHPVPEIDGSIIIPPVAIAPTAKIVNCIIGPYVSIADNVEVKRAVIRDTILNEGARVEDVLLTESLIGERAVVNGNYTKLNIGDSSDIRIVS